MKTSLLEKTDTSLVLEFNLPPDADYFDGHFPEFKLLPAVAQVDIVLHIADKYFGCGILLKEAKRLKFSAPILPDTDVRLEIKYDKDKKSLSFGMKNRGKTFSSGALFLFARDEKTCEI